MQQFPRGSAHWHRQFLVLLLTSLLQCVEGGLVWRVTGLWPPESRLQALVCQVRSPVESCCNYSTPEQTDSTADGGIDWNPSDESNEINQSNQSNATDGNETNSTALNISIANETNMTEPQGDSNETSSPVVECPSSVDPVDSIDTPNCELRMYSDSFCSEEVSITLGLPACGMQANDTDDSSTQLPILTVRDGYLQFYASDVCAAASAAEVRCVRMFLPEDWLSVSDDLLLQRVAVEQGTSWSLDSAITMSTAQEWNLATDFVARWISKTGGGLPELVLYRASSAGVPVWAGAVLCTSFMVLLWILLCGLSPPGFFCRVLSTGGELLPMGSFTGQRPGVHPSRPEAVTFPDPRSRGARTEEVVAFSTPGSKALSELCCADFLSASYPLGPEVLRVEQLQYGQPQFFLCTSAREALDVVLSWNGPSTIRLLSPVKHEENFKVQRCGGDNVWDASMAVLRAKFSRGSHSEQLLMRTGDAYLLARGDQSAWSDMLWPSGMSNGQAPLDNGLGLQQMLIRDALAHRSGWKDYLQQECGLHESGQRSYPRHFQEEWDRAVGEAEDAIRQRLAGLCICCVAAVYMIDALFLGVALEEKVNDAMQRGYDTFIQLADTQGEEKATSDTAEIMRFDTLLSASLQQAPPVVVRTGLPISSVHQLLAVLEQVVSRVSAAHRYAVAVIISTPDKAVLTLLPSMPGKGVLKSKDYHLFSPHSKRKGFESGPFLRRFQDSDRLAAETFAALQPAENKESTRGTSQKRRSRKHSDAPVNATTVICNVSAWTFFDTNFAGGFET
mmetsp:Transcript_8943/g.16086  ORF Transcript_8943/g.16086 Transcript_8943/m.16086 type:complete len:789 (-) Transcript_8943:160-2526(-)